MRVLVYSDAGVSTPAFVKLYQALERALPASFNLKPVNHKFLIEKEWEKETTLFILPGGRDLPYQEKLKGEGNQRIKNFVEKGGAYFGICAGGYYASSSFEFEKGGSLEIIAERDLKFFPGRAIGPAYGKGLFQYGGESGYRVAELKWGGKRCEAYYNGGCFFEEAEQYENVAVLATYRDIEGTPPAIILCKFGKGKALLSGVHPEYPLSRPESEKTRVSLFNHLIRLIIS